MSQPQPQPPSSLPITVERPATLALPLASAAQSLVQLHLPLQLQLRLRPLPLPLPPPPPPPAVGSAAVEATQLAALAGDDERAQLERRKSRSLAQAANAANSANALDELSWREAKRVLLLSSGRHQPLPLPAAAAAAHSSPSADAQQTTPTSDPLGPNSNQLDSAGEHEIAGAVEVADAATPLPLPLKSIPNPEVDSSLNSQAQVSKNQLASFVIVL